MPIPSLPVASRPLSRARAVLRAPLSAGVLGVLAALGAPARAQGPAFESPGQSPYATLGQTTRFSTELNPALGLVIDAYADAVDADEGDDGFDAVLRLLEVNAAAFVDPDAWAYVVLSSEELESVEVEEAAVEYLGLEGATTVKAGRFFVDFGKQMQWHLEELRTLERPLVLRAFLGEELAGTGVQVDHWLPLSDDTPLRFSIGVFGALAGEGHGHEDEDEPEPELHVPDRKDFDELSFAARVTAMTEVGDRGTLQLGASARVVPEFAFELDDLEEDGLSNVVWGVDLTYGRVDETATKRLTSGVEALLLDGDLAAEVDDPVAPTSIDVVDDEALGAYGFLDYAWSRHDSAGVQYSWIEEPEDPSSDASELDLYYTRHMTELRRLRFGVTLADADDGDELRAYVQFTNFFGSHAHGLNW